MAEFFELIRLSESECRFEKRDAMPPGGFRIFADAVAPNDRAASYNRFASTGGSHLQDGCRVFLTLDNGQGEVWGFNPTA